MVTPGSWNTSPSRNTGVLEMLKNRAAASAEASLKAVSRQSTARSGRGTMKIKKATGKAAAAIQLRPRKRNPPAARKQMNDKAISERKSLWLKDETDMRRPHPAAKAASPATKGTIANPGTKI